MKNLLLLTASVLIALIMGEVVLRLVGIELPRAVERDVPPLSKQVIIDDSFGMKFRKEHMGTDTGFFNSQGFRDTDEFSPIGMSDPGFGLRRLRNRHASRRARRW